MIANKTLSFIFQDWSANSGNAKGKFFSLFFRLSGLKNKNMVLRFLLIPVLIFYKIIFEWLIGIEIPAATRIGPGLKVYHLQAIVINGSAIIGRNCVLRQSTTIGNKEINGACPVVGDNVDIGANVCIIGGIEIGDNVIIGAGSVVVKSVPANCVIAGNPARIIRVMQPQALEFTA